MSATFKILGSEVVSPNGNPTTLYTPGRGKTAIVGKIIIVSTWPDREREGYHHVTSYNSGVVQHLNQSGQHYFGYPQGVDVDNTRGYRQKASIIAVGVPPLDGLYHLLSVENTSNSGVATYSMFTMAAGQTPLLGLTLAPRTDQILEINQGVPLNEQESLTVTNGLTDLSSPRYGEFQANQYTKKYPYDDLLRDHRARACSIRATVFGQEITT